MNSFETINMADMLSNAVDYLWHPSTPIGMATFLSGDAGLGKSFSHWPSPP